MVKRLKVKKRHYNFAAVFFIAAMVVVGFRIFFNTHAQAPFVVSEAENGTPNCQVSHYNDPTTGDAYERFGNPPPLSTGTISQDTTATALTDPTHFDDTQWNWPSLASGYSNLTINVTPEADGSPDGDFFAVEFYFVNNSSGWATGYMGLQTDVTDIGSKGDIFSIWGALSATGSQDVTTFTEGTSGWSTRNAYTWVVGHMYTYQFNYNSTQSDGEHWEAWITDDTNCATTEVGEIVVPTNYGLLSNAIVSFHERYSGDSSSCSSLHLSDVEFTDPAFNGNVPPIDYNSNLPDVTGCTSDYGVKEIPGGYRSTIGGLPPAQ